jgi:hypothetical protein
MEAQAGEAIRANPGKDFQPVIAQGKGIQQISADQLFPDEAVTHFSVCGPGTQQGDSDL